MCTFVFEYELGQKNITENITTGEYKKKDVLVKLSQSQDDKTIVNINSEVNTDENLWKDILDRFMMMNDLNAYIEINDGGAKPGTVLFRLNEAVEQL